MLNVIGAGFGRTGTHSLALALEILGFGPVYRVPEIQVNPGHKDIWSAAIDGKTTDWDALFQDYAASVEWPGVAFLSQLTRHYPRAKVILTYRDPELWYQSARATIFEAIDLIAQQPDPSKTRDNVAYRLLLNTFSGRHNDRDHAIAVYRRHIDDVRRLVPSQRLLQYQVSQGWEPLCGFLGVNNPNQPFPIENQRQAFIDSAPEWAKKIRDKKEEKFHGGTK